MVQEVFANAFQRQATAAKLPRIRFQTLGTLTRRSRGSVGTAAEPVGEQEPPAKK